MKVSYIIEFLEGKFYTGKTTDYFNADTEDASSNDVREALFFDTEEEVLNHCNEYLMEDTPIKIVKVYIK